MAHALGTIEGVATVVIAIYVASVGTFQWTTAREKLRLDLYNRRFEVYLNALAFMQALMMWSSIPIDERQPKRIAFIRAIRESRFLFADDPRVLRLLEEFNTHSFKVTGYIEEMSQYMAIMPKETIAAHQDKESSMGWIMESIGQLETLLMPYLAFRLRSGRRIHVGSHQT
jgi:hypothetical protein